MKKKLHFIKRAAHLLAITLCTLPALYSCGDDPVPVPAPTAVAVTGVTLTPATAALEIGDTLRLVATVTPPDAANKNVTWRSSNKAAARVSSTGLITATAEGETYITVTTRDGGKTASCAVTVSEPAQITMVTGKAEIRFSIAASDAVREVIIDWGDGLMPEIKNLSAFTECSHTYSSASVHTVRIYNERLDSIC